MPLLADYALTPDVFDVTSYTTANECEARLDTTREALLTEGLVRDLRSGAWRSLFRPDSRPWHRRGLELVKKLTVQGRLVPYEPVLDPMPSADRDWCAEALATATAHPFLGGVIATEPVKLEYPEDARVARIDRLASARWWHGRSSSVRLPRTLDAYRKHLHLVLRCSNSLLFLDPHLDPVRPGYRGFAALVAAARNRAPAPRIQIHRVCYDGSGPSRRLPMREDQQYFERRFRDALAHTLRAAGLTAEVFIWDDFHDRYLISNLVKISLPNGFDTTTNLHDRTTWSRLGRDNRDEVAREFDPAGGRHALQGRFRVP